MVVSGLDHGDTITVIYDEGVEFYGTGSHKLDTNLMHDQAYDIDIVSVPDGYNCNIRDDTGTASHTHAAPIIVSCLKRKKQPFFLIAELGWNRTTQLVLIEDKMFGYKGYDSNPCFSGTTFF